jgi:hypothetical protein
MTSNNFFSFKSDFINQIKKLLAYYQEEIECGVFFRVKKDKSPLEILGVLNFLRDKIRRWGNNNIFSYSGELFNDEHILVIGSTNIEEAKSIVISVFLSNIVENEEEIGKFLEKLGIFNDLQDFLSRELSQETKKGYPSDLILETKLKKHIDTILQN